MTQQWPGDLRYERGVAPGSSALFSLDGRHRYVLERHIGGGGGRQQRRLVACGLNPSTADAFKNDPTVRREIGFAESWGCEVFVKVNAYAWRDTKPSDMWVAAARGADVVGAENDMAIRCALTMMKADGGIALAAWGVHAKPERVLELVRIAQEVGVEWMCLGTNKGGSPRHPLYVPASTQLQPWLGSVSAVPSEIVEER